VKPQLRQWYQFANGEPFEVVAYDEDIVEVQYEDGSVEEMALDDWNEDADDGLIKKTESPL
jgi:hypothetical protein